MARRRLLGRTNKLRHGRRPAAPISEPATNALPAVLGGADVAVPVEIASERPRSSAVPTRDRPTVPEALPSASDAALAPPEVEPVTVARGSAPITPRAATPEHFAATRVVRAEEDALAATATFVPDPSDPVDELPPTTPSRDVLAAQHFAKRAEASEGSSDDLSLSSSFFAKVPQDSLAPVTDDDAHDLHFDDLESDAPVATPEQLARRGRLRRVVGAMVGALAVLTLGVAVVRPLVASAPAAAVAAAPAAIEAAPAPVVAPVAAPKVDAPAPQADAPKAEEPKVEPAEEPKAEEPKVEVAANPADAKKLLREAVSLLERGKRKDAVTAADRAIAADPGEALGYLVKGSALQDVGDVPGARAAFDACVQNAKRGPVYECAAFGGKKKR